MDFIRNLVHSFPSTIKIMSLIKIEKSKRVVRSKSKNRYMYYNGKEQKGQETKSGLQNTNWKPRSNTNLTKTKGVRCSEKVSNSCTTSCIRRVNFIACVWQGIPIVLSIRSNYVTNISLK